MDAVASLGEAESLVGDQGAEQRGEDRERGERLGAENAPGTHSAQTSSATTAYVEHCPTREDNTLDNRLCQRL